MSEGKKKYDAGKPPVVSGCFRLFPDSLEAISIVSQYGANKYEVDIGSDGWKQVENGIVRYDNAEGRHSIRTDYDEESGLLHAAHRLWDAAAVLQLMLEQGVPLVDPVRGIGPHIDINKTEGET